MKLMGVDVGFSNTRLTTGIACLDGDQPSLARTGTAWESRKTAIPGGFQPTLIALGPLLPRGADKLDWLYERMVTTGRLESVLSKALNCMPKSGAVWTLKGTTNCGPRSSACLNPQGRHKQPRRTAVKSAMLAKSWGIRDGSRSGVWMSVSPGLRRSIV
jgi:hypothetical protein